MFIVKTKYKETSQLTQQSNGQKVRLHTILFKNKTGCGRRVMLRTLKNRIEIPPPSADPTHKCRSHP